MVARGCSWVVVSPPLAVEARHTPTTRGGSFRSSVMGGSWIATTKSRAHAQSSHPEIIRARMRIYSGS